MPAVPGGRPARPAGRRPTRLGRRSPPGTPRLLLPAFPSGRAGPPARPRPAAGPSVIAAHIPGWPISPTPWGGSPGLAAVRGADLTGRAEASVRRRGSTDGPRPGTRTAPGRPAATPGADPGTADDRLLTIEEVTAELRVSRAAFYRWRRAGAGPPVVRLPGGGVRVRRSALTWWLRRLEADTREGQEHTADG